MRRKLLAEPSLSLDKAVAIALAMGSTGRNVRDLQKSQHSQAVNVLKNHYPMTASPQRTQTVECYCCERAHFATECCFKDNEINVVCARRKGT